MPCCHVISYTTRINTRKLRAENGISTESYDMFCVHWRLTDIRLSLASGVKMSEPLSSSSALFFFFVGVVVDDDRFLGPPPLSPWRVRKTSHMGSPIPLSRLAGIPGIPMHAHFREKYGSTRRSLLRGIFCILSPPSRL